MIRVLVMLVMAVNLGLGLGCVFAPELLLAPIGVEAVDAAGRVELRAMYGGLQLGVAAFLGWCLVDSDRLRVGLVAGTLEIGGLGIVRAVSWLIFQPEGVLNPFLVAVELGGCCLGAVVLWQTRAS